MPQAVDGLAVVLPPPERRCRAGTDRHDRSDPPVSVPIVARGGSAWDRPMPPSLGVATVDRSLQEGFQTGRDRRIPCLMARLWTRPPCPRHRTTMGTRTSSRQARDPPPRSGAWRPSCKGLLAGSDPRGRGQECANTPGPQPAAGARTAGSLPAPPERPDQHRPVGVRRRKTFARGSFRSSTGAHGRTAKVRIDSPCRLRAQIRLKVGARACRGSKGTTPRQPLGYTQGMLLSALSGAKRPRGPRP